jgi:hypothetical protein
MAFGGSALIEIHKDLCERQKIVGHLSRIEFDDDEYKVLLRWGQEIVHHYERWPGMRQGQARIVFLAFVCEYVRRNKPVDDNVFWDDFFKTLGLESKSYQFISYELLWEGYAEIGIERRYGPKNKKIVESLLSTVKASDADRTACIDFFCWYYYHHSEQVVTSLLLQEYEAQTAQSLHIHEKSIPLLNQDFQILTGIIEHINDCGIAISKLDPSSYREMIISALGEKYDLAHIHFIRSGRRLQELFARLENSVTPTKFLQRLEQHLQATVYPPKGSSLTVRQALQYWRSRPFSFGLYRVDQVSYRVVPMQWLSLDVIKDWPYGQIITALRRGYLGYKKDAPFTVKIGGEREASGRRCILEHNEICYIWVGEIPKGEPFTIDGYRCAESEGIDWDISLRMNLKDDVLGMTLVFDTLKVYLPATPRGHIAIYTSQGHIWDGYLTLEGTLKYNRAITFQLSTFLEPITITLCLGDQLIGKTILEPDAAYLFSSQTHERISTGSKQSEIGQQYYLFTMLKERPTYDENSLTLEQIDDSFGNYSIYRIIWTNHDHPFSLSTGNLSWLFERRYYFAIQAQPRLVNYLHLTYCQIQSFDQSSLQILTDIPLERDPITCQIYVADELIVEEKNIHDCLEQTSSSHLYRFTSKFLAHIDQKVQERFKENRYNHYDIFFIRAGKTILDQISLALLPEVHIHFVKQRPTLEGEKLELMLSSPQLPLWDSQHNIASTAIALQLYPGLHTRMWDQGVPHLVPQTIRVTLVFPTIGETVEIEITPVIFGFRLFQYQSPRSSKKRARFQRVEAIDYYALKDTICYIFSHSYAPVEIEVEGRVVWKGATDENGDILIKDLEFLKSYIHKEQTQIVIRSEEVTTIISLYWRPVVYALSLHNEKVHVDVEGPKDTSVVMSLVNVDRSFLETQIIKCPGRRLTIALDISSLENNAAYYLIPSYILGDGTRLNSAQQWRIDVPKQDENIISFSVECLQAGIGISDKELLPHIACVVTPKANRII